MLLWRETFVWYSGYVIQWDCILPVLKAATRKWLVEIIMPEDTSLSVISKCSQEALVYMWSSNRVTIRTPSTVIRTPISWQYWFFKAIHSPFPFVINFFSYCDTNQCKRNKYLSSNQLNKCRHAAASDDKVVYYTTNSRGDPSTKLRHVVLYILTNSVVGKSGELSRRNWSGKIG